MNRHLSLFSLSLFLFSLSLSLHHQIVFPVIVYHHRRSFNIQVITIIVIMKMFPSWGRGIAMRWERNLESEKEGERRDDEVRWMSTRMGLKKEMMMNKMILMQRIIYNTIFFPHFLLILISSLSHPSYIFWSSYFRTTLFSHASSIMLGPRCINLWPTHEIRFIFLPSTSSHSLFFSPWKY